MLLCDIGNTSYHFLKGETAYKKSVESFIPSTLKEKVYYICVHPEIQKTLKTLENWIDLSCYIDRSRYYETMGIDRILACEAIDNGVIVDAGSAITVDVMRDGVFWGGFIYPGVQAMAKAYANISVSLAYEFNFALSLDSLAKNSQDAISYGFLKLLHTEVYAQHEKIYLTGGDAHTLAQIFPDAQVREHLLFDGMKQMLKAQN